MKQTQLFVIGTVALSTILFSSCMHMGMTTMHDGGGHQAKPESTIEKEVIDGDVKAVVRLPLMEVASEAVITLKLTNTKTAQPLSGAKVQFSVQYHADTESHKSGSGEQMRESGDAYTVHFKAAEAGEHTFTFVVTAIGERTLEREVTIEAKQTVAHQQHEQSGGMMGMSNTSTYVIVGAVVMGAIMVAMIVANGGMR